MPIVYFIRHGSTGHNRKGLTRSWGQFGLDAGGVLAAKRIGQILKDKGIQEIHSSDLRRARETANVVAGKIGARVQYVSGLRTWNLGRHSGKPVVSVLPQLEFLSTHPDVPAPEGESKRQWFERSASKIKGIVDGLKDEDVAAVVFHGRHMNGLDAIVEFLGGKSPDLSKIKSTGGPGPGAVVKLTIGKNGIQRETLLAGDKTAGPPS